MENERCVNGLIFNHNIDDFTDSDRITNILIMKILN